MKKILITGGAGFVGSVLVGILLDKGYYVRVLDRLMYGGESLLSYCKNKNFEIIIGDITDKSTVKAAVKGMDVIVHLAAIVGFPACKKYPEQAKKVNVEGSRNINEMRGSNQLLLYASTGSSYGDLENTLCTEETELRPLTEYGFTKSEAEKMFMDSKNAIAYRFATGFGISYRMRLDLLINDFVYQAVCNRSLILYEKHFKRSFIHVNDMGRAFLFGIENADKMAGNVYNVGDESMNYSKEEIALEIRKKIDFYLHFADICEDLDKRNYVVSYQKIKNLGYRTSITLQDGIDNLQKALALIIDSRKQYSNV